MLHSLAILTYSYIGKYGPDGKAPPLKIQLYKEEFSFSVSADDQTRLKLMSQVVDINEETWDRA